MIGETLSNVIITVAIFANGIAMVNSWEKGEKALSYAQMIVIAMLLIIYVAG